VLVDYEEQGPAGRRVFTGRIEIDGETRSFTGRGNGLISGVVAALAQAGGPALDVTNYQEHAIGRGASAQAVAYVECHTGDGRPVFGAGIDPDIATASVKAVLSAANNAEGYRLGMGPHRRYLVQVGLVEGTGNRHGTANLPELQPNHNGVWQHG